MQQNNFYSPRTESTRNQRQSNQYIFPSLQVDLQKIREHFSDDLKITEELSVLSRDLDRNKNFKKAELLRHSLAARLSSMLDFYLHELCRYVLIQVFQQKWQDSDEYKKLSYDITLPELREIIDSGDVHRKVYDYISKKEHYCSYINSNDVRQLLRRLSLPYEKVCGKSGYKVDECSKMLDQMNKNRNSVVHQASREYRDANPISIGQEELEKNTRFLEKFVNAIQSLAEEMQRRGWVQ